VSGVFIFDKFVLETVSSGEENSCRNFRSSRGLAYKTLVQYVRVAERTTDERKNRRGFLA